MPVADGAVQSPMVIVQTSNSIILLIFCVLLQSITEECQVSNYSCGYFSFLFLCFCFMFKALLFGAYTLRIVMSSWWSDHCITIERPSLCLVIFFVLKSTLSKINITTQFLGFFSFLKMCAWYILFHPFTLNLPISSYLKLVSWVQHIVGTF